MSHEQMLERNYRIERRTGLATRAYFDELLTQACATQPQGVYTGVVYLDLDHFKHINDTYGHIVGDEVISEIGHRLRGIVGVEVAARWGGDEFALLVVGSIPDIQRVVRQVECCFTEPVMVSVGELVISTSVGVAVAEDSEAEDREITMKADEAMYRAKKEGRGITRWNILDCGDLSRRWDWISDEGSRMHHE